MKILEIIRSHHFTIRRWTDLILLSIISALILFALHPILARLSDFLFIFFLKSKTFFGMPFPIITVIFLASTFIWYTLINLGGLRYHAFGRIITSRSILYPPTWPFAFIGALVYFYLSSLFFETVPIDICVFYLSIVSLVPGIIFAVILHSLFSSKHKLFQTTAPLSKLSFRSLLNNSSAFREWLNKETPIQKHEEDLFNSSIFAKKIIINLMANPMKTIALVGSYGSGKSSMINMAEEFLKMPEFSESQQTTVDIKMTHTITCKVHGWGLKQNTAVEHILKAVLSELSKSVDCLGISNLPADYQMALSKSGSSWLKSFVLISNMSRDPLEILRKLDIVLKCINTRLIIFLEDLDRNTTGLSYWKELTSLLDRLKELDNLSFVLAINQDSKKYDTLIRICEHIEFIPILQREEILECMKFFRDMCLDKYAESDIDCRTRKERDEHIGLKKASKEYDIADMLGLEVNDPIIVITKLLHNPRTLKLTLRSTLNSWNSLHGEIDFDDLLAAKVIYTVAPEAYAFVNENISTLRNFNSESTSESTRKLQIKNRNDLNSIWDIFPETSQRQLLKILIDFLFPGWIEDSFYKNDVPQGVLQSKHTDYWIRLNRNELTCDEIPDQTVIRAMHDWKLQHDKKVYKEQNLPEAILGIIGFASILEQFGHLLNGHEIRLLASQLFDLVRKRRESIPKAAHYNGFIELWRMSLQQNVEHHEEWILDEIRKTIPVDLRFANELYYYWRSQERPASAHYQTLPVREGYIASAREIFENNEDALISAIDPTYIYIIRNFMIYFSETDGGGPGFDPAEWKWLGDVLIKAAYRSPQIIVPQLVCLISEEAHKFGGEIKYSINLERLNSIFTNKKMNVLQLLTTKIDTSIYDQRDRSRIEYVRQLAKADPFS